MLESLMPGLAFIVFIFSIIFFVICVIAYIVKYFIRYKQQKRKE